MRILCTLLLLLLIFVIFSWKICFEPKEDGGINDPHTRVTCCFVDLLYAY